MAVIYIYIYNLKMCGDLRLFFCIFFFFREDVEFQNGRLVAISLLKKGWAAKYLECNFYSLQKLGPFSRPVLASKPHV